MHHCGGGGELVCQSLRTSSTPLVQIVLGVLVTYLPFFPDATLDPELFMVLFIAPLLYLEAHEIDKSALLKNAGSEPIAGYRTGYRHDGGGRIHFACRLAVHHLSLSLALGAALGPTVRWPSVPR